MRAVLDTNDFLRIILAKNPNGVAGALWGLLHERHFDLVCSESLLVELREPLAVPELAKLHHRDAEEIGPGCPSSRAVRVTMSAV